MEVSSGPAETASRSGASHAASQSWPVEALPLAERLHRQLSIGDREWHALKRQRPRRAAEQVAAALVQLLAADDPAASAATEGRRSAMALLENAQAWLRAEITDPGCPAHGR
ncbi:MAG: DUF6439 family protein [Cyanobium sp. CZS 25K]|nr:DUF6439 family protein [Cyanobium sp. CZS25K]